MTSGVRVALQSHSRTNLPVTDKMINYTYSFTRRKQDLILLTSVCG